MGFEPTRAEPNGLAVHRLNHSATSSLAHVVTSVHFELVKSKFLWILTFQKTYFFVWIVGCHWMIGVTACLVTVFYQHQWFSGRMLACHAGGPGSIPGWCNFLYIFILTFFCIFHSLNWLRFSISRYVFNKLLKKVRSEQKNVSTSYWSLVNQSSQGAINFRPFNWNSIGRWISRCFRWVYDRQI